MLRLYTRHLYRDRRRLVLSTALILLAGYFGGDFFPDDQNWIVGAEFLVIVGFIALTPMISIFAPRRRHWGEIIALGNPILTFCGTTWPDSVFGWHGLGTGFAINMLAFTGLVIGLHVLIYGKWSDGFARRVTMIAHAHARSRLTARTLWPGLVPVPGQRNRLPDPDIVSIDYLDAARSVIRLITWTPDTPPGEIRLHVEDNIPEQHIRVRVEIVTGIQEGVGNETWDLTVTDRGEERLITYVRETHHVPLRRVLRGWLDDTAGRMLDVRLAAVEYRACNLSTADRRIDMAPFYDAPHNVDPRKTSQSGAYRTAYGREMSEVERALLGR